MQNNSAESALLFVYGYTTLSMPALPIHPDQSLKITMTSSRYNRG
jgi:hypothetical protein